MNEASSLLSAAWSFCSTILYGTIVAVPLVWAMIRYRNRRVYALTPKLTPIMTHYPIVGIIPHILGGHKAFTNMLLKRIQNNWGTKKRNFYGCFGPTCYIGIGDEDDVKTVLSSKKCKKGVEHDYFLVNKGLFICNDDIHKQTRPHMNHLFTPRNVDRMLPEINRAGRNLVRHLSRHVGHGEVDIFNIVGVIVSQSISGLLFGENPDLDQRLENVETLQVLVDRFMTMVSQRVASPWLWPDCVYNLYHKKILKGYMDKIVQVYSNQIQEILREQDKSDQQSDNLKKKNSINVKDSNSIVMFKDAYNSLRNVAPEFSEEYIYDEIATLVIGGFHTSKAVNSATLLALAAYPDVQERLYQEIVDVVGTGSGDITTEDLSRMTYLDMVVNEGMRKFNVVPLLFRSTKEDLQLSDMIVPEGTTLAVFLGLLSYNRELFPNAEKFDPEHFSAENRAKLKKHSFTPFGQGQRVCIANNYGLNFAKVMVAQVIRRFRLTTTQDVDNMQYGMTISAYSLDGYHVECHPRN